MKDFFRNYFDGISQSVNLVKDEDLISIAKMIEETSKNSRKLIIAGNGGSASMASHVCVDFTKAVGVRSVNFNEANLVTCFANDYGYENWVSQALEAYADQGDIVILISSSGKSQNILNAAIRAKELGLSVVTLSGFDSNNPLRKMGEVNLWVDSDSYNFIEMTHHIWLLSLVDYLVERKRS
ncbi:SIS domain-containing protein [Polynucleobacter paneuropaeus]|nr:SIS domain-containing protein [Polynucleobacter paneuropaeus]